MTELYDDCNFKNKSKLYDGSKSKWQEFDEVGQHGPITDAKLSVAGDLYAKPWDKFPTVGELLQKTRQEQFKFISDFRSVMNREKTKTTYFQPKS